MFDVILYQPEIPPNTGNAIRLCANTGARLHLVAPLGFSTSTTSSCGVPAWTTTSTRACRCTTRSMRRSLPSHRARVFALSTRNSVRYDQPRYAPGDAFVFGPETRGLAG